MHKNRITLRGSTESANWPIGSGPSMGRVGSGRIQIFSLLSGLGRIGSIYVGLCGSPWIIQNVMLSVIVGSRDFYRAMDVVLVRYCYRKSSVRPSVRQ